MIELEVLAAASHDDARTAIERLGSLGPVILLVPGTGAESVDAYAMNPSLNLTRAAWTGASRDRRVTTARSSSRRLDAAAAARLDEIRLEHDAGWLIAAEATLPTARACPGLRVICVGPADDGHDPTRPDHRAHSLLDAARFIEMSEAFA